MTPQQAMPELPERQYQMIGKGHSDSAMHAYALTYAESLRSELEAAMAALFWVKSNPRAHPVNIAKVVDAYLSNTKET